MEKFRAAYAWAREHKRLCLAVTAMAGTAIATRVPGFPTEKVVSVVAVLLGA